MSVDIEINLEYGTPIVQQLVRVNNFAFSVDAAAAEAMDSVAGRKTNYICWWGMSR